MPIVSIVEDALSIFATAFGSVTSAFQFVLSQS